MSDDRQRSLFDPPEGRRRRDRGRTRVSAPHAAWLEQTRNLAVRLARAEGSVTTDTLRAHGVVKPEGAHDNLWGAVFADDRFEHRGFVQSRRPQAHARYLRVWGLREEYNR